MKYNTRIAVVGMGGVFPDAFDLDAFWQNIVSKKSSSKIVPEDRWIVHPDAIYSKRPEPDKSLSKHACLIRDFCFDPNGFELTPDFLAGLDPLYPLVLEAARQSLSDIRNLDKTRTGVILAAIALPTQASSALARTLFNQVLEEQLTARMPQFSFPPGFSSFPFPEWIAAKVTSLPGAILARAFGLHAGTYTLDAACASSLYAVKLACDALVRNRADVMLAGGVSRPDCLYSQIGFSQLRALSPSGKCAPFDEHADGLVVGEGAGILVLKRLDDAIRDGETIYGIIHGIGLSNDMRGNLLAPDTRGQVRAMRQAYENSGWQPDDVELIECHGAGTPVGDATELQSIRTLWEGMDQRRRRCAIGSVKSNIGHLLTGAGAAGMIKTLLAIKHKTFPPSLNFQRPHKESPLIDAPFRVQTDPEPWDTGDKPRRAAVSAFGFGGINAHVLFEEFDERSIPRKPVARLAPEPLPLIAITGMETIFGNIRSLDEFREDVFTGKSTIGERPRARWKGADAVFEKLQDTPGFNGGYMTDFSVSLGEFQIPPNEIPDILPQQLLMLKAAAGAMQDAGLKLREERPRMGVIIGTEFDFEATHFNVRWNIRNLISHWQREFGWNDAQARKWHDTLSDACGPALTHTRTLGNLGGIVASRIAREFRFGGPSFIVSGEEQAGMVALEIGVSLLEQNELDAVVIGAIDLVGDIRNSLVENSIQPYSKNQTIHPFDQHGNGSLPGEGAAALVLKRLDQALSDGNKIYAVIKGIGRACDQGVRPHFSSKHAYIEAMRKALQQANASRESIGYIETHGSGNPDEDSIETEALHELFKGRTDPCAIGSVKPNIGLTGAASGLASIVKTALCLYHRTVPPLMNYSQPKENAWHTHTFHVPVFPHHWYRNREKGPRNAGVVSMTADGNCSSVILEESEKDTSSFRFQLALPSSHHLFVIYGAASNDLNIHLDELSRLIRKCDGIGDAARSWYHEHTVYGMKRIAMVADHLERLENLISDAQQAVQTGTPQKIQSGIAYSPDMLNPPGEVAFVYPGSGNHYIGMGRGIGVRFPEILHRMDQETLEFKSQMLPELFVPYRAAWHPGWETEAYRAIHSDPLNMIFGQVVHGGVMTNVIRSFDISPRAVIGYSLGESAGYFAMGVWPERGEMLKRMKANTLFSTEIAGPCHALRQAWNIPDSEPVNWSVAVLNRSADQVRERLSEYKHVRLLIVNTYEECVIGGLKHQVEALIRAMKGDAVFLEGVVTVHSDALGSAFEAYRNLHVFPTSPPEGIRFYSCVQGRSYDITSDSAADSIVDQALYGFSFPKLIEQAYKDGVRVFVEMGPRDSCTRMIRKILNEKPHLAVSACVRGEDDELTLLKCIAALVAEGVPVNLEPLYLPRTCFAAEMKEQQIIVPVAGTQVLIRDLPEFWDDGQDGRDGQDGQNGLSESIVSDEAFPSYAPPSLGSTPGLIFSPFIASMTENFNATGEAHQAFLDFSTEMMGHYEKAFGLQVDLLMHSSQSVPSIPSMSSSQSIPSISNDRIAFPREMCMEFAIGSIEKVLGPEFRDVDTYRARVRLPDEPLMLVDRILSVHGEKAKLGSGKVVTEHDVKPGAWYLDGNRAPVCISVEAGQADLFLCSYLGIDLQVKGKRTYRLLDATVRFFRGLPEPGDTIRYEIEIERFVRQGETWMFFFKFDGFIGDEHLIRMRNGCAGFFTEEEIENSGGIILTQKDTAPEDGKLPDTPYHFVPLSSGIESYDDYAVESLRKGDLASCFGDMFEGVPIAEWLRLPGGKMRLLDRIIELDARGGRFGLGKIRAEADIHPDDWFLTCHFVDDRVMPGTLMYECCAHTFRILLQRFGWITDQPGVCYEPVIGMESVLKCRGPVTPKTQHVIYEIEIKEIGFNPEPYAIADALMYGDGRRIVRFKDMGMKMTGLTRDDLVSFWSKLERHHLPAECVPLYDYERILAFCIGNPSDAFGEPYRIYDEQRIIARLPGPPYLFMSRITQVEPEPWVLKPDGWIECQYDVPGDEWYFKADRSGTLPFCVLLEIGLQPCGWLAAYMGSALRSPNDLKFRNLGGTATQYHTIYPKDTTLTVRCRLTNFSEAGEMIIEHFDLQILESDTLIYEGTTYFGFFTKQALAQQIGIRGASQEAYQPPAQDLERAATYTFEDDAPLLPEDENLTPATVLALPSKALRMIDSIDCYIPDGGPQGLGFIRGVKWVDPNEWFFTAHFYQDPVCPGSLGIESFLQLIKFVARDRWGATHPDHRFEIQTDSPHHWIYRGQIIRTNKKIEVEAVITDIQDEPFPLIRANGYLKVDGLYIYQMNDFGLKLVI